MTQFRKIFNIKLILISIQRTNYVSLILYTVTTEGRNTKDII